MTDKAPLSEPLLAGETHAERIDYLKRCAKANRDAAQRLLHENETLAQRWGMLTFVMTPTIQKNVLEMDRFNRFAHEQEQQAHALDAWLKAQRPAAAPTIRDRIAALRAEGTAPAAKAAPDIEQGR
jgi:hypothetical protein